MTTLKTLFPLIAKAAAALNRGSVNFSELHLQLSIIYFALALYCRSLSHFIIPRFCQSASLSCLQSLVGLYVYLALILSLPFSNTVTQHSVDQGPDPYTFGIIAQVQQPRPRLVQKQSSDTLPDLILTPVTTKPNSHANAFESYQNPGIMADAF